MWQSYLLSFPYQFMALSLYHLCTFRNVDSAVKVRNSSYGQVAANLPIWLTKLQCEGTERDLSLCIGKNQSWGNTGGCTHEEDAGVICVQRE